MEKLVDWTNLTVDSLKVMSENVVNVLPNIVGAILLILLGWIIALAMSFVVRRALRLMKFDTLSKKLKFDSYVDQMNVTITPSQVVGKFVFWIIILLFFVSAADTLGWRVVSDSISDLLAYLPRLLSSIVIFVIGLYIANFVRTSLNGIFKSLGVASGTFVSIFSFYLIMIIISLTALRQAGVDTQIITSNISIILGGFVLAFAVSFGFGSKEILGNILSSFYSRSKFFVGQHVELEDISGVIEKIDNTSCVIKTKDFRVVVPISKLLSQNVKILDQQ